MSGGGVTKHISPRSRTTVTWPFDTVGPDERGFCWESQFCNFFLKKKVCMEAKGLGVFWASLTQVEGAVDAVK